MKGEDQADKLETFEDSWKLFKGVFLPKDASEGMEASVKSVFFAGGVALHRLQCNLAAPERGMTPSAMQKAHKDIVVELGIDAGIEPEKEESRILLS